MALSQTDSYKLSHKGFMQEGTEVIYSNFTPRNSTYFPCVKEKWDGKAVFFGLQYFIKDYLIDEFNRDFFSLPKEQAVGRFKRLFDNYLGKDSIPTSHFEQLYDLGYLPLRIKALPEGSRVNMKVPFFTVVNTHPDFAWLTNYIETVISCEIWKPSTVATIIAHYRQMVNEYALETTGSIVGTEFQVHGFEFRGMSGRKDAAACGAAFLLSSNGTDTIPAIEFLEKYYNANSDNEFIATSVPASEHSLASTGIAVNGELETYRKWITQDYPSGIVSVISDTLDFFEVITTMASELKQDILNRTPNELGLAKVVFRPDSGCPVKILTGYKIDGVEFQNTKEVHDYYDKQIFNIPEAVKVDGDWVSIKIGKYATVEFVHKLSEAEVKGAVQCLWDIFGGTTTEQGYRLLHERVGLIYGDSITPERALQIMERLKQKGFASTNVVFGVGSFTSQYITRDSLGMAMKATAAKVNGQWYELFKDPKTDNGVKKSAKGLLRVEKEGDDFVLYDQQTPEQESQGELREVFCDGKLTVETSLQEIRNKLWS